MNEYKKFTLWSLLFLNTGRYAFDPVEKRNSNYTIDFFKNYIGAECVLKYQKIRLTKSAKNMELITVFPPTKNFVAHKNFEHEFSCILSIKIPILCTKIASFEEIGNCVPTIPLIFS